MQGFNGMCHFVVGVNLTKYRCVPVSHAAVAEEANTPRGMIREMIKISCCVM